MSYRRSSGGRGAGPAPIQEFRRKKEGRRKKEEGRRKKFLPHSPHSPYFPYFPYFPYSPHSPHSF